MELNSGCRLRRPAKADRIPATETPLSKSFLITLSMTTSENEYILRQPRPRQGFADGRNTLVRQRYSTIVGVRRDKREASSAENSLLVPRIIVLLGTIYLNECRCRAAHSFLTFQLLSGALGTLVASGVQVHPGRASFLHWMNSGIVRSR